jgi:putative ABC transport system substrate-binding protein
LFAFANRAAIIAAAMEHKFPAVFAAREFVAAGGLLSYGTSITERNRQLGRYLGRILKGNRPADLPIDQPTHFELVINRKAAERLGITLPPALLARADVVVE